MTCLKSIYKNAVSSLLPAFPGLPFRAAHMMRCLSIPSPLAGHNPDPVGTSHSGSYQAKSLLLRERVAIIDHFLLFDRLIHTILYFEESGQ